MPADHTTQEQNQVKFKWESSTMATEIVESIKQLHLILKPNAADSIFHVDRLCSELCDMAR